jgi:AcrR family transcriptional regulator
MNPQSDIPFAESKQDRSQKTLEDILQAAEQIVAEANPENFTSRSLAQKSGYALGTLVRRLGSIENVFLRAAKNSRDKKYAEIARSIAQFDNDTSIHDFAEKMVERTFTGIQQNNPKVMRFFESRYTKMKGLPSDYFTYMDFIVDPYLEASHLNKTNTFRQLSRNEATLLLRQLCLLIERPFMEDSPIAGTEEHRKIVIDSIIRLLGK